MLVEECGMEDMTPHFMPRRSYREDGRWICRMRREDRHVTGRGDYILGMIRHTYFNVGVREARIHTDHWMVLAVLQGEGAQRNGT